MMNGRAALLLTTWLLAPSLHAQTPQGPSILHTVEVKDTTEHLFHVRTELRNFDVPELDLSLPAWTPGWYRLEHYGRNVRMFTVRDADGNLLASPLIRPQTWRVPLRGKDHVVVEFDYVADVLALNHAKVTDRFAFFTGVQLFLEPVGFRDLPATVLFVVPEGWRVISALSETTSRDAYVAPDYDTLVDSPTWLGAFQVYEFTAGGKPYQLVLNPEVDFPGDSIRRHGERLAKMVITTAAIFGGDLPYEKYVHFWLPGEPEGADGAIEHNNSVVTCCGGPTQLGVSRYAAHEFFHVWNVKRIRPAELWPYDYSRAVETASLWVSEGFAEYYGRMIVYRAGFTTERSVIASLAQLIASYESNEERHLVSPSDASIATWRGYLQEPVSYYSAGDILGALLDLSILNDTGGARGLDDVMRLLYERFYLRGRGFTPEDLVGVVSEVAARDYTDFFRQYVTGVEVPPYDSIFAYAGIRTRMVPEERNLLQMTSAVEPEGRRIQQLGAGTPAYAAGLRYGDLIVTVNGMPVEEVPFTLPNGCCVPLTAEFDEVLVTALRGTERVEARFTPVRRMVEVVEIDMESPTPAQLAVRQAWLRRQ